MFIQYLLNRNISGKNSTNLFLNLPYMFKVNLVSNEEAIVRIDGSALTQKPYDVHFPTFMFFTRKYGIYLKEINFSCHR